MNYEERALAAHISRFEPATEEDILDLWAATDLDNGYVWVFTGHEKPIDPQTVSEWRIRPDNGRLRFRNSWGS